eukprot:TRINITY_DN9409_c0_g4_i4.p1 TRINITY_DN9409_c0_g4~~TRINITY_DN9409_c0_g4_i4.p1  ORF type:complete len:195 (+),score=58.82 TRINITY_DN9409_c0_g4_i4:112-696(+)
MSDSAVHPLAFALKYTPPTLVMQYYLGEDQRQEYVHKVNVFLKTNVTAEQIVEELVREDPKYFSPQVVPTEQLIRLVQKLIDNKGRKENKLRLKGKAMCPFKVAESKEKAGKDKDNEREVANKKEDYSELKEMDSNNEEDIIIGDNGKQPIRLKRVMIEETSQEVLVDEQRNVYDMQGNYMGKLDDDIEIDTPS